MSKEEQQPKLTDHAIHEINNRFGLHISRERIERLIAYAWSLAKLPVPKRIEPTTIRQLEKVAKNFQAAAKSLDELDEKARRYFALFAGDRRTIWIRCRPKRPSFQHGGREAFLQAGPNSEGQSL